MSREELLHTPPLRLLTFDCRSPAPHTTIFHGLPPSFLPSFPSSLISFHSHFLWDPFFPSFPLSIQTYHLSFPPNFLPRPSFLQSFHPNLLLLTPPSFPPPLCYQSTTQKPSGLFGAFCLCSIRRRRFKASEVLLSCLPSFSTSSLTPQFYSWAS